MRSRFFRKKHRLATALLALIVPPVASGAGSPERWQIEFRLGLASQQHRELSPAAMHFGEALGEAEKFSPADQRLPLTLNALATAYREFGQADDAWPLAGRAWATSRQLVIQQGALYARVRNNQAICAKLHGQRTQAAAYYRDALAACAEGSQCRKPRCSSLDGLGGIRSEFGDLVEAERLYREALELADPAITGDPLERVILLNNLGAVCYRSQRTEEAITFWEES